MSEEKKNALIRFWESIEKVGDSIKTARAAKSLQRQAEIDVAKAQENKEKARADLETAKVKAKETQNFQAIVDAFMKYKVESKKFDDAMEVYKELFEETPKLLVE